MNMGKYEKHEESYFISPLESPMDAFPAEKTDVMTASPRAKKKKCEQVSWYYAPAFLLVWLILFFTVKHLIFLHLPTGLSMKDEAVQPGAFIAERAKHILTEFDGIGTKVVGSFANENRTLQLLLDEVEKIRLAMHNDLFQLHVDVQEVSGNFQHFGMVSMYRGVQNLAVRLRAKNSTSHSYLLINSHFDSKPGSSAAGDDGAMVVVMLEVLRVLATTRQTHTHPIVFLFNGAEETGLQGAHGFITQHKWAKNCKAVINLDSAGSGHKELLFQSVSDSAWVIEYYRKHNKHPFASTVAEEIFEANFIPSDTDFRIWKNFGKLQGLDFANVFNGYVYHTKFDKAAIISADSLQSTGDNILSLARAFADAPELSNSVKHTANHAIFYDFLGLIFIFYTEFQGQILNVCVCIASITMIIISIWRMAAFSFISIRRASCVFAMIFALHVIAFVLSLVLPLVMAIIFDSADRSMSWFTNTWLVLGLYACPCAFGLAAPTLFLMSFSRHDKMSQSFKLQLLLHSHCAILVLLCLIATGFGVRSTYLLSLSIMFYLCSVVFNVFTNLQKIDYFWVIPVMISQIFPFLYFTYLGYIFLYSVIPIMGRSGSNSNPDLKIAALTAITTILAMGFLIPLLNIYRKSKTIALSLIVITIIFSIIAFTPVGFPYRPGSHVGRVQAFHVHRIFYEYDKSVSLNESGILFEYMDRHENSLFKSAINDTALHKISDNCTKYMMCGLPILNRRWNETRPQNEWMRMENMQGTYPSPPKLTLTKRTTNASGSVRFEFELEASSFMGLFLQPFEGVTFTDWTFVKDMLQSSSLYQPPFHVQIWTGKELSPLKFYVVLKTNRNIVEVPLFKLGIYTHFVNADCNQEFQKFVNKFPNYLDVMFWPTAYERYIF